MTLELARRAARFNDIGFGLFRNRLDCFGAQPEPPTDPQGCFSMQSTVVKRSVIVESHKTSVSLEDAFWSSLRDIAASRRLTKSSLQAEINRTDSQAPSLRQYAFSSFTTIRSEIGDRSMPLQRRELQSPFASPCIRSLRGSRGRHKESARAAADEREAL